jgi:hypothetical protein
MYRTSICNTQHKITTWQYIHKLVAQVSNSEPGKENYMLEADTGLEGVSTSRDEHLGSITKECVIVNPSAIIQ